MAKRYAPEIGTPLVNRLFSSVTADRMMCLSVGTSEVISVLVRKKNASLITDEVFSQALADFRAEVITSVDFQLVAIEDSLIFAAQSFIEQYSLNATDTFVLRSALDVATSKRQVGHDLVLLTSDRRLLTAVRTEGLQAFNPETDLQAQLDTFF